ncbi:hypothetical protein [Aquimarina brevivitae]|uniref:Uncharacterized protein n=1 Tax=Aquimarina brevivitae TaxID=323412 RepID=A0A4Q7PFM8_9FLAO|nr:hypothetical protein [Aquimarina brevivitae]RZS99145.1 hypothetical protein EV197_0353 [Aquimarina brevivitae]
MKNEHQLLLKVSENFEGMHNLDIFDLLHKIEMMLYYLPSPLHKAQLKQAIAVNLGSDREIDFFHFTILPSGNFYEFLTSNNWLQIYKEQKRALMRVFGIDIYYFKTKYAPLELLKLTRKNLLENQENTSEESAVKSFLEQYQPTGKDPVTNCFLLVKVR